MMGTVQNLELVEIEAENNIWTRLILRYEPPGDGDFEK